MSALILHIAMVNFTVLSILKTFFLSLFNSNLVNYLRVREQTKIVIINLLKHLQLLFLRLYEDLVINQQILLLTLVREECTCSFW